MRIDRLFDVLVIGGAALLGTTACGAEDTDDGGQGVQSAGGAGGAGGGAGAGGAGGTAGTTGPDGGAEAGDPCGATEPACGCPCCWVADCSNDQACCDTFRRTDCG